MEPTPAHVQVMFDRKQKPYINVLYATGVDAYVGMY